VDVVVGEAVNPSSDSFFMEDLGVNVELAGVYSVGLIKISAHVGLAKNAAV